MSGTLREDTVPEHELDSELFVMLHETLRASCTHTNTHRSVYNNRSDWCCLLAKPSVCKGMHGYNADV